jgi:hypothetical protein
MVDGELMSELSRRDAAALTLGCLLLGDLGLLFFVGVPRSVLGKVPLTDVVTEDGVVVAWRAVPGCPDSAVTAVLRPALSACPSGVAGAPSEGST